MNSKPLVAVIGGGIAGQSAAEVLSAAGALVTVFDKGRGAGGRLATRRAGESLQWDHGAQYFTARDPALKSTLGRLQAQGVVAPWHGVIGSLGPGGFRAGDETDVRFVGQPRMSALVGALGSGATVYGFEVREIATRGSAFTVTDRHGEHFGPYDAVVVATPAPQAVPLLALAPELAGLVAGVEIAPCWALLLSFARSLERGFDGAFVDALAGDGVIAWIARDSSKPGRPSEGGETWVVHATPDWSADHVEDEAEEVARVMRAAFERAIGPVPEPLSAAAHRWRHAMTTRPLGRPYLLDTRRPIGVCGDWCLGARIEGAFLSGRQLGLALAGQLGLGTPQSSSSASQ